MSTAELCVLEQENKHLSNQRFLETGIYTSPQTTSISGIPTAIVDQHWEVFPFWYSHVKTHSQIPAVVIHVDNHKDLADGAKALPLSQESLETYLQDQDNLQIANFVSAGFYHRLVSEFYHINPRKRPAEKIGDRNIPNIADLLLQIKRGRIKWKDDLKEIDEYFPKLKTLKTTELSYQKLARDLQSYKGKLILDIDLDAFENISDIPQHARSTIKQFEKMYAAENWDLRIARTAKLLTHLPRPSLITIARSQTPYLFCPAEYVDKIQEALLRKLGEIY